MWAKISALLLLAQLIASQESDEAVRRLRFRRPRPKLIDVENPDGDLVGSPVELKTDDSQLAEVEDLVAAAQNARQSFPSRNSGSAALDALIATAQRVEPELPAPQQLEIEEVATRRPLEVEAPRQRAQRPRTRGGIPARSSRPRARPSQEKEEGNFVENGGSRRRPANQREEPVATLERYSHKNDDGSFTFGYVGADGSFREETRGADCITRGKYGYIDPDGVKREYTYTSGLPCEIGADNEDDLQNLEGNNNVEDTVDPKERFRQTQNEQLDNTQIPEIRQQQIAGRQRTRVQRPQEAARPQEVQRPQAARPAPAVRPAAPQQQANTFANFGSQAGNQALNNLLTIADPAPAPAPARRPTPTRGPIRIAPRPQAPAQPAPGTFNFDSELEGFTLNRPAIKFDASAPVQPPQNQFESQLSFNQNTGVFQTSLQQNLPGGAQIRTNNNAAPTGQSATTRAPATTVRFSPTPRPQAALPPPTPRAQPVLPAGTIQIQPASQNRPASFAPLSIPQDIGQVKVAPTPARPAPTPAEAPRAASPAPITVATPPPVAVATFPPTPAPTPAPQASPSAPAPADKSNPFFVFQPFNQQPASTPFRTPVNHDAFRITPQTSPARPPQSPPTLVSQGGRPIPQPQAVPAPRPASPAPQRPAVPAPQRPTAPIPGAIPQSQLPPGVFAVPAGQTIPQGAIRVNPQGQAIDTLGRVIPAPSRLAPQRPNSLSPEQPRGPVIQTGQPQPQLQFGFQPVNQGAGRPALGQPPRPALGQPPRPALSQPPRPQAAPQRPGQSRPAPFTAFGGGAVRPAPQFQGQPQQLGVPPQLQQPGQFSQFDSRFAPRPQGVPQGQFRPAQFQPGQPSQGQGFNVFSPSQLRGA